MYIYRITNKLNGKAYIGITSRTVEERFKEHAYKGSLLHKAIAKYGEENFTVETLAEAFDENEMKWLEQMFIQKLDTLAPKGYNLTLGGEGILGYKHSEETKRKLSEAHTGKTLSEDHKRKMSKANRSAELCSKPIVCLETGVKYPSAREAARQLGLHHANITSVLKGRLKTTGGYTFAYVSEEE